MSERNRRRALEQAGLLHPRPDAVSAPLFGGHSFFFPADKVQVKYEMLRAHLVDGLSVIRSADLHGFSRAAYYLIEQDFAEAGMLGLLDEKRGRRGPIKLRPDILAFLHAADPHLSGAQIACLIAERFGVILHRRTIERARRR